MRLLSVLLLCAALHATTPIARTSSPTITRSSSPSVSDLPTISSHPISNVWSRFGQDPGLRTSGSTGGTVREMPTRTSVTPRELPTHTTVTPAAPWSRFDSNSNPPPAAKVRTTTERGYTNYPSYPKTTAPYSRSSNQRGWSPTYNASPYEARTPYRSSGYSSQAPYAAPRVQYAPRSSETYRTYQSSGGAWSGHASASHSIEHAQPAKPQKG